MADETGKGAATFLASIGFNLPTIIQVVSVIAVLFAQWQLMNRSIDELEEKARVNRALIDAQAVRLYAIESENRLMNQRLQWLERSTQRQTPAESRQ